MGYIMEHEITKIDFIDDDPCYDEVPCDVDLLVWAYDEWVIEHVTVNCDTGVVSPANGVEFTHWAELPSMEVTG